MTDTCYWDFEVRSEREVFTRKVERLCRALDERPQVQVKFRTRYSGREFAAAAKLKTLWVAGSYARGAMRCGDLDLIFDYDVRVEEGQPYPDDADVRKALFGASPQVRFYRGTPEKNASHVAMAEAVPVWTGPGCDWRATLASIRPDPIVKPAERKTQVLPFRMEQIDGSRSNVLHLEDLVDARQQGLVTWEFLPLEPQHLAAVDPENLEGALAHTARHLAGQGKGTQQLAPALLRLVHFLYAGTEAVRHSVEQLEFLCGSTRFAYGRVGLQLQDFSAHLALSEHVLVPALSARGPNGAWVIRRGPAHPLSKLLALLSAWAVTYQGSLQPITVDDDGSERRVLELFATREDALDVLGQGDDTDGWDATPVHGHDIVRALGEAHGLEWISHGTGQAVDYRDLTLSNRRWTTSEGWTSCESVGWEFLQNLAELLPPEQQVEFRQLKAEVDALNDHMAIDRRHLRSRLT